VNFGLLIRDFGFESLAAQPEYGHDLQVCGRKDRLTVPSGLIGARTVLGGGKPGAMESAGLP